MKKVWLFVIIIAVIIVAVLWFTVSVHNSLIAMDESVNANWSQIETQLQRRADLIPNLVSAVKGYAVHEEKIFTGILSSYATVFRRFLSGANLSLVDARITAVHSLRERAEEQVAMRLFSWYITYSNAGAVHAVFLCKHKFPPPAANRLPAPGHRECIGRSG